MRSIDIYKQVTAGYTLINYDEQHQLFYQKTQLTEYEAHELNYAFAINGTSKRYVKDISRFNNKQTK
jgi:hypothetical protein